LRTLYARSKFVVIPILESDTDHGATSILEAMAMGKAVICSKTTGQVDVIQEGRTGLLVPHGNPSDLRKAIEYLWENPEVAEKLGAEGRRQVEREHAIETFVSNVKSIVSDVILSKKEDSDAKHSRTFVPATRAVNNVNIPSAAADAKPSPHGPLAPSRLKILMIFHFCPNPPPRDLGPAKRTYPLLREALRRHDVSVLTFGSPEEERSFRKQLGTLCDRIVFVNNSRPRYINFFRRAYALLRGKGMFFTLHSRKMQKKLDELCRENHFDLIHCATPLLGFHRFPTGVPLVSDTHNVEHDLLYRSFLESKSLTGKAICYVEYKLGKPQEIKNCEKFDAIVATTKRDYEVLHAEMPHHRISVIQNGVDPSFLEPLNIDVEPRTMVFTGLMSYFPNTHGILFFLNEVFPHIIKKVPSALLYIVGKSPSKVVQARASSNVIVTGFVEDVRPYIARSQVYIIPLLIGGGIRGKALEAMAMKKAIVSTSIGCEGITLKDGESVVVADDPIEFADSVVRLFDAPEERERLGRNAHATVVREYDWEQKGLQFDELYRSIVKERTIR
ncbi:MAG TPA: hypothetical protein DGH68_05780, partial [Bacteroidetes bacterium]|nr:hypothetical protein [Bacteroidota bacterium]